MPDCNSQQLLDSLKQKFLQDRFATQATGIKIDDAFDGYAKCSFDVKEHHKNAVGTVMGGAIFTLADFAFAVASNQSNDYITVSASSSINFVSAAKGNRLIAEAKSLKSGKSAAFYEVSIVDENNTLIAIASVTGIVRAVK